MTVARAWKCGSSLAAIFCCTGFTDSASMRAWAGSYTPQGRSQCALTLTLGANRRESMEQSFLVIVFSQGTLLRGRRVFAGAPMGLGQKSGVRLGLVEDPTGEVPVMMERSQETGRGRAVLPFGVAEVPGPSMVPTLRHGDRLVVHYGARLRAGGGGVLREPFQQDLLVVKRA